MKTIASFLECNFATPMNTTGIGNPSAPEGSSVGSGDIPIDSIRKYKAKKKIKHLGDYIKLKK